MTDMILGDVEIARVEEMHGPLGMTPEQFFPGSPKEEWRDRHDTLVPDFLDAETGIYQVALQTWVLRSEGRTILIDTGVGNHKERPYVPAWGHLDLDFLGNLERAGVKPDEVDIVVNTHLHVDHVGWNTRLHGQHWVPTFRNATYLMPKADFEFWNPANNPKIAGSVNQNAFEDSIAPVHEAGQVLLWESEHTIDANLRLRAAPGHTPGSSVLMLDSGGDRAVFAGDVLHSPFQIAHPDHSSCFCEDPDTARVTRREILGWAADHHALILPAHFTGHGALEVARADGAFDIKRWSTRFARL
jgi:glyoxylase-like metal-dependent hydrolase (beta-lactamase superfamily II)